MSEHDHVDGPLDRIRSAVVTQLAGTLDAGTVDGHVNDSYVAPHRTAWADQHPPEPAHRIAADRLTSLPRSTQLRAGRPPRRCSFASTTPTAL